MLTEPACCDAPMVHNSFTQMFECADAYFTLVDDGVIDDLPLGRDELADVGEFHRGLHEHWMASMVTDCCHAPTSLNVDPWQQEHRGGCNGGAW